MVTLETVLIHGLCWLDAVCCVSTVSGVHHDTAVICILAVLL
jgi:hypothetical protein